MVGFTDPLPRHFLLTNTRRLFAHDTANYHDPDTFKPDRFLGDEPELDPYDFVFGFGRRYFLFKSLRNILSCRTYFLRFCPGRHFGDASLFITMALVLHVFDITPPVDEKGEVIKIEPRMEDKFVS